MPLRARRSSAILLSLCVSILLFIIIYLQPAPLVYLQRKLYDSSLALCPPHPSTRSACVVDIDERSVREVGEWPWPQESMARLVGAIAAGGPRLIGLDPCVDDKTSLYGEGASPPVRAIEKRSDVVVAYRFRLGEDGERRFEDVEKSRIEFITNPWGVVRDYRALHAMGLGCVDRRMLAAASACGFSNLVPDDDGEVRNAPLLCVAGGKPYMSFTVAMLTAYYGCDRVLLRLRGDAVLGIELDNVFIGTDQTGSVSPRRYKGRMSVPVFSAADVVRGNSAPGSFRGRIVVIGATGTAGSSVLGGRGGDAASGVFIHATVVENIVNGQYLRRTRAAKWLESLLVLLVPLCITLLWGMCRRFYLRFLTALAVCIALFCLGLYMMVGRGEILNVFYPSASVLLYWVALLIVRPCS
jgi:adenylate cyclase